MHRGGGSMCAFAKAVCEGEPAIYFALQHFPVAIFSDWPHIAVTGAWVGTADFPHDQDWLRLCPCHGSAIFVGGDGERLSGIPPESTTAQPVRAMLRRLVVSEKDIPAGCAPLVTLCGKAAEREHFVT